MPPSFDVVAIKFNHNTGSTSSDGINLYDSLNNQNITAPEWKYYLGDNWNKKFGYIKDTVPIIQAQFFCETDEQNFDTLEIEADWNDGEHFWVVTDTTVVFADSLTSFINFHASTVPTSVGKRTIGWTWRITKVDGESQSPPKVLGYTDHDYYTVLANPQSPMSTPWTEVLDYACDWASGENMSSMIVDKITLNSYYTGFKNYNSQISHCDTASTGQVSLNLTNLLSGTNADCKDMAAVVQVFSNAIGVSGVYMKRISGSFNTQSIDPIGTTNPDGWFNLQWNYHQVGWYSSSVYDSCLRLDQDSPRVPRGEDIDDEYKDDLYSSGTWNVNTGTAYISTLN